MSKIVILIFVASVLLGVPIISASEMEKHSVKPQGGFVPNEATAIKIAEAIWLPIYGDKIYQERPFVAVLKDGVWFVRGTLPKEYKIGGVAEAEILKVDGCILRVSHGK